MATDLFSSNFSDNSYWWDENPRSREPSERIPSEIDTLIIGSGYTGTSAAIEIARGGRSTFVIDSQEIGWGCSSRNGGQVSTGIKSDIDQLSKNYGLDIANSILREGHNALAWIGDFIDKENIECDFVVGGKFHGAHTARHYERFGRQLAKYPVALKSDAYLVPRSEQISEIGTDFYHGGLVFEKHASLDPAAYHSAMVQIAESAGARFVSYCTAESIHRLRGSRGFRVKTGQGEVRARDVVIATNGYTQRATPWHQRRIIPIGSYIIATEDFGAETGSRLIPRARNVTDSRRLVVYYRLAPGGNRLIFGGRVSLAETNPRRSAPRLYRQMLTIFPELAGIQVSHSWMGFVGWTFSGIPHIHRYDGVWCSMGYCGSGIALSGYLGAKLGQQVLGLGEGVTAFDAIRFQARPYYFSYPWFLGPSIWWYGQLDRMGI